MREMRIVGGNRGFKAPLAKIEPPIISRGARPVVLRGSPPNEDRDHRGDCKHEQSHRNLILYGIACLAGANPHVDEGDDPPKHKKTLDRCGDHSHCCSRNPTAKVSHSPRSRKPPTIIFSVCIPRNTLYNDGQRFPTMLPDQYPVACLYPRKRSETE